MPPWKLWKAETPGHCISKCNYFLDTAIPEVVTNFIILAVPLPYVWRLQMKRRQKILVTCIFALGGLYHPISTSPAASLTFV